MLSQNNTKNTRQKASKHGKNTSFQPNFCQKTMNFREKWPSLPFLLHFYALIFFKVAKKVTNFFQNLWQKNFPFEKTNFKKKILMRLFEWKILALKTYFLTKIPSFWSKIDDFLGILWKHGNLGFRVTTRSKNSQHGGQLKNTGFVL